MALLNEDGSLNVEWIRNLPIEEFVNVYSKLTTEQEDEYWSKIPSDEPMDMEKASQIDDYIDNQGVDAMEFLTDIRKKYGY